MRVQFTIKRAVVYLPKDSEDRVNLDRSLKDLIDRTWMFGSGQGHTQAVRTSRSTRGVGQDDVGCLTSFHFLLFFAAICPGASDN